MHAKKNIKFDLNHKFVAREFMRVRMKLLPY